MIWRAASRHELAARTWSPAAGITAAPACRMTRKQSLQATQSLTINPRPEPNTVPSPSHSQWRHPSVAEPSERLHARGDDNCSGKMTAVQGRWQLFRGDDSCPGEMTAVQGRWQLFTSNLRFWPGFIIEQTFLDCRSCIKIAFSAMWFSDSDSLSVLTRLCLFLFGLEWNISTRMTTAEIGETHDSNGVIGSLPGSALASVFVSSLLYSPSRSSRLSELDGTCTYRWLLITLIGRVRGKH